MSLSGPQTVSGSQGFAPLEQEARDGPRWFGSLRSDNTNEENGGPRSLGKKVRGFWIRGQRALFPRKEEGLGPMAGRHKKL